MSNQNQSPNPLVFRFKDVDSLVAFCKQPTNTRPGYVITGAENGFNIYAVPVDLFGKYLAFAFLTLDEGLETDSVNNLLVSEGFMILEGGIQ